MRTRAVVLRELVAYLEGAAEVFIAAEAGIEEDDIDREPYEELLEKLRDDQRVLIREAMHAVMAMADSMDPSKDLGSAASIGQAVVLACRVLIDLDGLAAAPPAHIP